MYKETMAEITLDSLIQEQRERIPQLHYKPSPPRCIRLLILLL